MILNILSNLGLLNNSPYNTIILVDYGFSEFIKWNNEIIHKIPILSLNNLNKSILQLVHPEVVICFISEKIDYNNIINQIKNIVNYKDLIILTTLSQELYDSYETTNKINKSISVRIIHLPCHTINILQGKNKNVGLFNLMSPSCRNVFPIMLHHLGNVSNSNLSLNNKIISKVNQIAAEDVPLHSRQGLKLLAHELAGSLIFNQGLDPTGNVYSIGKTSSLVGHTIQSILANLVQQRTNQTHEGFNLMSPSTSTPSSISPSNSSLRPCTLLLMDRTIDLFTPSSHDPSPSLAQRIFCTIKNSQIKSDSQLDISLTTPLLNTIFENKDDIHSNENISNISIQPLSAVSSLPIQILPSIISPYLNKSNTLLQNDSFDDFDDNNNNNNNNNFNNEFDNNQFMNAVYATNEEKGKNIVYETLKKEITENNGSLPPPKKRGIGAEVLGLVNALLSIPPSQSQISSLTSTLSVNNINSSFETISYNVDLAIKSSGLLSWCLGIIDSMQRSSTKQLQAHISSLSNSQDLLQCLSSYEMKSTRERVLLSSIIQQYQLSLVSYPILIDIILETFGLIGDESSNINNTVDIEHLLVMILSTFSLIETINTSENRRQNDSDLQEILSKISTSISKFLLKTCPVIELKRLQFLSDEITNDIIQYRELIFNSINKKEEQEEQEDTTSSLGERLLMELEDVILNYIDVLNELSTIRSSSLDPSALSNTPSSSSSSSSISTLSNDFCFDMLMNYDTSSQSNLIPNPKHKVVKRGLSEESKPGSPTKSTVSSIALPIGIITRITSEIIKERMKYLSGKIPNKIPLLFHIENPIFSIARAGFGLLSSSLGRFGLSTNVSNEATSHPSNNSTLVIFIIGGISLNEVKQIQELLNSENNLYSDVEVIIGSNNIVTPQNIYQQIFIK